MADSSEQKQLDEEWLVLIEEARDLGLSIRDIQNYMENQDS
ncbi:DNA-binding anti-repressor SinI [Halobacillus rhizosphaerae]